MSDPISAVVLSVFLSVTYVGVDKGFPNTPDAAYVCGFDQTLYEISDAGDVGVYFVPSTDPRFTIRGVRIDNDAAGDFSKREPTIRSRSLSFYAANTKKQTVYFTVDVLDRQTGAVIHCDPQMTNTPTQPG